MTYSGEVRVQTPGQGWTLLARATGQGTLKGIAVAGSDHREHYVRIIRDGTQIVEELIAASRQGEYENAGHTFDIPFDNELKVYGRDRHPNPTPFHRYWITITRGNQPVRDVSK